MNNMIYKYVQNMTRMDVDNFAKSKGIFLNDNELNFTFNYIKRNYEKFLNNPNSFNIDNYKNEFQNDNFIKVKKVFNEYFSKYHKFL